MVLELDETVDVSKTYANGVNVVFDLPLDEADADYVKAQEILDNIWKEDNTD